MFDLGSLGEILIIGTVALVIIGPKEMPIVMRKVGQWVHKLRLLSFNLRQGIDSYIQEDFAKNEQNSSHFDENFSSCLSSKEAECSNDEEFPIKSSSKKSFYTSDDRK